MQRVVYLETYAYAADFQNGFVTREAGGRANTYAYIEGDVTGKDGKPPDVDMDIFDRGLCLPSDNKMTPGQQDIVIEMVKNCFR